MEFGCSRIWGLKQPKPRLVEDPISLPYLQPSPEPRPPAQTPNQAPVTLNSEFNEKLLRRGPYSPEQGEEGEEILEGT